jgi:N,N'-diacetyllegionaminate synthase
MLEKSPFIIAEAGVNHNGSLTEAFKLVDAAKEAGANAVKFQSFKAEELASILTPKVEYQKQDKKHKTHFEMLKALELTHQQQQEIFQYCNRSNIEFMSTPYSISEFNILKEIGLQRIKVASADIVDIPLHLEIAKSKLLTIVSTGMASIDEISTIVEIYGRSNTDLTLLHCTSEYPTAHQNSKVKRIILLKEYFGCKVGFSDHTLDSISAVLSLALGAEVFEKHITMDKKSNGPDHATSLNPLEFKNYVNDLRIAQIAFTNENFKRTASEEQMAHVSRKSLHFSRNINKGSTITQEDFKMLRPSSGLSWLKGIDLIGAKLIKDVVVDEPVTLDQFEVGDSI